MACAAVVLLNVTVPEPGVNVPPLLVQSPPVMLMLAAVPATKVPAASVMVPPIVSEVVLPPTVTEPPPLLLIVKLLKVWDAAVPFRFRAPVLLSVTVPDPGVNVVPVASVQSPATFSAAGAVNVPAVRLK